MDRRLRTRTHAQPAHRTPRARLAGRLVTEGVRLRLRRFSELTSSGSGCLQSHNPTAPSDSLCVYRVHHTPLLLFIDSRKKNAEEKWKAKARRPRSGSAARRGEVSECGNSNKVERREVARFGAEAPEIYSIWQSCSHTCSHTYRSTPH